MLPWSDMLKAALQAGVPPRAFWALSVREWLALSSISGAPLQAADMKKLMEDFPDGGV